MKKILVLGLMISLFAFGGNKEEVKTTYAAGEGTSAIFYNDYLKNGLYDKLVELKEYSLGFSDAGKIVSVKISNDPSDLPTEDKRLCAPRAIPYCTKYDALGNDITPESGVIFSYLSLASDSTPENLRYDCVVYADVETIYSNPASTDKMFWRCGDLETLDLGALNISNATSLEYMFANSFNLRSVNLGNIDTSQVTNMSAMFFRCLALEEIKWNAEKFDTSNVLDMSHMFDECNALKELNISSFNTSQVNDMSYMFQDCSSLTTLDVSHFDTSNVTTMEGMFTGLNVTELDVSHFNTAKVTNMMGMFGGCMNLANLNVSNFDTTNVTNMSYMFLFCQSLTNLNLSNFNTSKVTDITAMFTNCTSLKTLDISSFNLSNCVNYRLVDDEVGKTYEPLTGCTSLEKINTPAKMYADSNTNSEHALILPEQFGKYSGVSALTSDNIAEIKVLDITINKFISEWRSLRDENNSICAALVPGSAANTKLNELLKQYEAFDIDTKTAVDNATDVDGVTIGESITYINNVLNGTQLTEKDYGIANEDSGSFMTLSIKEESPYLIAVISLIGVLSVAGYYFYNKKKHAN